jgi:hypothetical protein
VRDSYALTVIALQHHDHLPLQFPQAKSIHDDSIILSSTLMMFFCALALAGHIAGVCASFPGGVIATGTQGVTNPPVPTLPTTIDQTSMARLLSINSIDDFCIFAPPYLAKIPDTEVRDTPLTSIS